jgi:hypothetical protein
MDGQQAVCAALQACLSPDSAVRTPAEVFLRDAEGTPGFCTLLMQIATSGPKHGHAGDGAGVSHLHHRLAVLAVKGVVGRCWAKARDLRLPTIGDDEKTSLRTTVLAAVCSAQEPDDIATELAVIVAKISRTDFPRAWPELLPALIAGLNAGVDTVPRTVEHACRTLQLLLREQTTKRLMTQQDRLDFMQGIVPAVLPPLAQLWRGTSVSALQEFEAAMARGEARVHDSVATRVSRLLDKCLLRLLSYGFRPEKLNACEHPEAQGLLEPLLAKAEALLQLAHSCREAGGGGGDTAIGTALRTLLRGLCRIQAAQPRAWLSAGSLALCTAQPPSPPSLMTRLLTLGLSVVCGCGATAAAGGGGVAREGSRVGGARGLAAGLQLLQQAVARQQGKRRVDPAEVTALRACLGSVLGAADVAARLLQTLVTQLLPLEPVALEEWVEWPEGSLAEESSAALADMAIVVSLAEHIFGLAESAGPRAWGSSLLLALATQSADAVLSPLVQLLTHAVTAAGPPAGGVRELEALVYVGGLLAKPLADGDFDVVRWACQLPRCAAVVGLEGTDASPSGLGAQAVLERRMAWLYGQLCARPAQVRRPLRPFRLPF